MLDVVRVAVVECVVARGSKMMHIVLCISPGDVIILENGSVLFPSQIIRQSIIYLIWYSLSLILAGLLPYMAFYKEFITIN